jgi:hypothetical protein
MVCTKNGKMICGGLIAKMQMECIVAYFKGITQHFSGGVEKNKMLQ